jgi:hypothetical protein
MTTAMKVKQSRPSAAQMQLRLPWARRSTNPCSLKTPLPVSFDTPRFSSVNDHPVPSVKSDHEMKFFYDDEGHREIPRTRWITNTEAQ